jgi:hypothetical protein
VALLHVGPVAQLGTALQLGQESTAPHLEQTDNLVGVMYLAGHKHASTTSM